MRWVLRPRTEQQLQETERFREFSDKTGLTLVDGGDGDPFDAATLAAGLQDHFRLDVILFGAELQAAQEIRADGAIAALDIIEILAGSPGEQNGTDAVGKAAQEGHAAVAAASVTDHEIAVASLAHFLK